jgi:hypothetical protein
MCIIDTPDISFPSPLRVAGTYQPVRLRAHLPGDIE